MKEKETEKREKKEQTYDVGKTKTHKFNHSLVYNMSTDNLFLRKTVLEKIFLLIAIKISISIVNEEYSGDWDNRI